MSSGVKLVMYLSYYDPNNELAVEPIEIAKSDVQLLSLKNPHHESNLLPKTSVARVAVPVKTATASH
jgi:hypothetical protein